MPGRRRSCGLAVVLLLAGAATIGGTAAAFTSRAESPGDEVVAAPDFSAPTVPSSAIAKTAGGVPGFIRQSGTYYVYANVADTGNPASGVSSVTADVSAVTTGQTAVLLSPGAFSVGGTSYGFRSAALTAKAPLGAGSAGYEVAAIDVAANAAAPTGFTVTVDNTAPAAATVLTQNNGSTARRAEAGDAITFTYTEQIDPASIVSTWSGSGGTPVVVRLVNGGLGTDQLTVYDAANAAVLPLGTVDMGGLLYVGGLFGGETAAFGATGTPSTMTQNGAAITITLGTASGQGATTNLLDSTATWTPSAGATDRAGNPSSTASVNRLASQF